MCSLQEKIIALDLLSKNVRLARLWIVTQDCLRCQSLDKQILRLRLQINIIVTLFSKAESNFLCSFTNKNLICRGVVIIYGIVHDVETVTPK